MEIKLLDIKSNITYGSKEEVADDDERIVKALKVYLSGGGYKVVEAYKISVAAQQESEKIYITSFQRIWIIIILIIFLRFRSKLYEVNKI